MAKGTSSRAVGAGKSRRGPGRRPRGKVQTRARASSLQSSSDSDYSEAVETVQRIYEERRSAQAVRILEANIDNAMKLLKESLQGYRDSVADRSSHATCTATTAHSRIEAANLVLHRNVSTLHQIRQQPASTFSYTLFDMPSKGRYRRVSIDGEVRFSLIINRFLPIFTIFHSFFQDRRRTVRF